MHIIEEKIPASKKFVGINKTIVPTIEFIKASIVEKELDFIFT